MVEEGMTKEDWLDLFERVYAGGFTDSQYSKDYCGLEESHWLFQMIINSGGILPVSEDTIRINSKATTLPVESVEDHSEHLPTNSTQTLVSGV